jgi:hypothetical protein
MSRLTLRLPETLHQQLTTLADGEGVSLNQYIVYALTRQASLNYRIQVISESEVEQQQQMFKLLLQQLGQSPPSEISSALAEREPVDPDVGLSADVVARIRKKIQERRD